MKLRLFSTAAQLKMLFVCSCLLINLIRNRRVGALLTSLYAVSTALEVTAATDFPDSVETNQGSEMKVRLRSFSISKAEQNPSLTFYDRSGKHVRLAIFDSLC